MTWMTLGRGSVPLRGSEATVLDTAAKIVSESWRMLAEIGPSVALLTRADQDPAWLFPAAFTSRSTK